MEQVCVGYWSKYLLEQACVGASMCWSKYVLEHVCVGACMCWSKYVLYKVCLGASMCWSKYLLDQVCWSKYVLEQVYVRDRSKQGTSRPPPLEKFIPPLGVEILGKCVCETLKITFSNKFSHAAG